MLFQTTLISDNDKYRRHITLKGATKYFFPATTRLKEILTNLSLQQYQPPAGTLSGGSSQQYYTDTKGMALNLAGLYVYQRGDIIHRATDGKSGSLGEISNPVPGVRRHLLDGTQLLSMRSLETGRLLIL
nr:hypothetical protein [Salmonella enterica]